MTINQLAAQLNTSTESAFQFAEVMVRLRFANRTDNPQPTYTFLRPVEEFYALVSGLSRCGARA